MLNKDNHCLNVNLKKGITPTKSARHFGKWIEAWAKLWNCPELNDCTVEFSHRMTRSLGKAYPGRQLIRLNSMLKIGFQSTQIEEVLCHEAAHLAVFLKHGNRTKPHGPEWQKLVQEAGFKVKTVLSAEILGGRDSKNEEPKTIYIHTCTRCGSSRVAKRPMTDWRCFSCRDEGMEGTLQITSQPSKGAIL